MKDYSLLEIINGNRAFIMGCAMICIMLFHQPFLFPEFPIGLPFEYFHLVGYHGVEIFLFISGIGIATSLSKNSLRQYYSRRIKRIVPACLFVGFCKVVVKIACGFNPEPTQDDIIIVTSLSLWYVEAIILYYLIAPILLQLLHRYRFRVVLFTSIICYLYGLVVKDYEGQYLLFKSFSWAVQRLPVFMFGMYCFCFPLKISTKNILIGGLALYALCFVVILQSHRVTAQWRSDYVPYLVAYSSPALCAGCALLRQATNKMRISATIQWIGIFSLEIYLCHEWFYSLFRQIGNSLWHFFMAVICSFLFAYLTKYICNCLINRIKI